MCPRCRSGAVGSKPALTCSGVPALSFRARSGLDEHLAAARGAAPRSVPSQVHLIAVKSVLKAPAAGTGNVTRDRPALRHLTYIDPTGVGPVRCAPVKSPRSSVVDGPHSQASHDDFPPGALAVAPRVLAAAACLRRGRPGRCCTAPWSRRRRLPPTPPPAAASPAAGARRRPRARRQHGRRLAAGRGRAALPRVDVVVARNDTLDRIFRRLKLDLADLASLRSLPGRARGARLAASPASRCSSTHKDGALISLERRLNETQTLKVSRDADAGLKADVLQNPLETAHAHGARRDRQLAVRGRRRRRRARPDRGGRSPTSSAGTSTSCSTCARATPSS